MIGQKTLLSFFAAAPGRKRSRSPEPGEAAEVSETGGSEKRPFEAGRGPQQFSFIT